MIIATYELHRYCRSNDWPVISPEMGAKIFKRLLKDIKVRRLRVCGKRHDQSLVTAKASGK